jgi:hypothetical protein
MLLRAISQIARCPLRREVRLLSSSVASSPKVVRHMPTGENKRINPDDFPFLEPVFTKRRGLGLVHDPIVNKGTAFPIAERDRLHIRGLVPPRELGMDVQIQKIVNGFRSCVTDIEKHLYMQGLHDRNETLFYRSLIDNIEEMAPIVYTPTVGKVCQRFGNLFRRTRGTSCRAVGHCCASLVPLRDVLFVARPGADGLDGVQLAAR